jgi:hypothetical protein
MAVEAKRGCGYRKVGGLYLCGEGSGQPCCKMPIILSVCPCCNGGIKQSRSWQWIDPRPWIKGACKQDNWTCPCYRADGMGDQVGLIWIGTQFYKTPAEFTDEAARLGISRRIKTIPRGFELGKHWVWFAHPKIQKHAVVNEETHLLEEEWKGGVFRIFKPTRLEKLITETMAQDDDEMEKLAKAGITPVIVPDNDRDHQGSVYDDDAEPNQSEMRL